MDPQPSHLLQLPPTVAAQPQQPAHQQQVSLAQFGTTNTSASASDSTIAQAQRQQPHLAAIPLASSYLPPMQLPTTQPVQQQQQQHQNMLLNHQQLQVMQAIPQRPQVPPRPMDPWPLSSGSKSFPPLSTASTGTSSSGFPHLPPIRLPSWPPLANQQPQQQQLLSSDYLATPMPSAATTPVVDSSARSAPNTIAGLLPLALTSTVASSSACSPFAIGQHQYQQQQDSTAMHYYQPYRALLGSPAPAVPLPPTPISASQPMFHHHKSQDTSVPVESSPFASSYTCSSAPAVVPIAGSALASALGHPITLQQQQRTDGSVSMPQRPTATRTDSYSSSNGTPSSVVTSPPSVSLASTSFVSRANLAQAIMNPAPATTSGPPPAHGHTYAPLTSMPTYQSSYQPIPHPQPSAASSYYAPYQHQFMDPFTHQQQQYPSSSMQPSLATLMDPPTPRPITTFTWDDMSTLVYQVDVDLIAVCRRAADNYVNGTKLLNLTAMSRGKRDSILKHERLRSVVKCGPMRLKGVWIPLDRARELARAVKVDAQVYPLLEEQVDAWVVQRKTSQALQGQDAGLNAPQGQFANAQVAETESESVKFVDMQHDPDPTQADRATTTIDNSSSQANTSLPVRPRRVSTSTVADALLALASDSWRKPAAADAPVSGSAVTQSIAEPTTPQATAESDKDDEEDQETPPAKRPRRTRPAPKSKPESVPTRSSTRRNTRAATATSPSTPLTTTRISRARSRQARNSGGNGDAQEREQSVSADDAEVVTALHLLAGGGSAGAPAAVYADAGTVGHANEGDEDEDEVGSRLIVSERERLASPLLQAAADGASGVEHEQEDGRENERAGKETRMRGGRGKGKLADAAKKSSASSKRKRNSGE